MEKWGFYNTEKVFRYFNRLGAGLDAMLFFITLLLYTAHEIHDIKLPLEKIAIANLRCFSSIFAVFTAKIRNTFKSCT